MERGEKGRERKMGGKKEGEGVDGERRKRKRRKDGGKKEEVDGESWLIMYIY